MLVRRMRMEFWPFGNVVEEAGAVVKQSLCVAQRLEGKLGI
jgi:hypothetical protein